MMKDRRFWPEQEEQAKALAISERKLLTIEYEAGADADGLRVLTMEELTELQSGMYANPYDGWIAVLEDHTEKTGAAWRTLQAVNRRFRELDAEEQTIDVLNDLPEAGLKLEDITEEFISYMRESGHELTYSIPAGPAGYRGNPFPAYFVVTSRACLESESVREMMEEMEAKERMEEIRRHLTPYCKNRKECSGCEHTMLCEEHNSIYRFLNEM